MLPHGQLFTIETHRILRDGFLPSRNRIYFQRQTKLFSTSVLPIPARARFSNWRDKDYIVKAVRMLGPNPLVFRNLCCSNALAIGR